MHSGALSLPTVRDWILVDSPGRNGSYPPPPPLGLTYAQSQATAEKARLTLLQVPRMLPRRTSTCTCTRIELAEQAP
eukprot:20004-Hanusia_phi.AAC.2